MIPKKSFCPHLLEKVPQEVKKIFAIFGDKIRIVGGATRDLLLEKNVADFDFACVFLPEKIIKILETNNLKALPTGLKYGTITAVINNKNFEITTLRQDKKQKGRDCEVSFIDDYFIDASRRDFSINALYLDYEGFVYDYFDGISDLQKKEVRFIGNAKLRIKEDYLRILRFFRFSCNYSQHLNQEGLLACVEFKSYLKNLSRERIRIELLKLISSQNHKNLNMILKVFFEKRIIQEISSFNIDYQAFATLLQLEKLFATNLKNILKLAVLFVSENFDIKVFSQEFCPTNLEKKFLIKLLKITQNKDLFSLNENSIKRLLTFENKDFVFDWFFFSIAKNKSINQTELKNYHSLICNFSAHYFLINAKDLIDIGVKKNHISKTIFCLKNIWVDSDFKLKKSEMLDMVISKTIIIDK